MDEKVLEEIQFHQETIGTDENSPLHLIREKEMEISGRVLAAKKEAEELVAEARKKAAQVVSKAEEEGASMAREHEKTVLDEVDREVVEIRNGADCEVDSLKKTIDDRTEAAVSFVLESITNV